MTTSCGRSVQVVFAGHYNLDAGPDFLEARLLIDKVLWIGHVEIHINSKDWENHHHQDDPAYDPVILHVVLNDDYEVKNSNGTLIPALVIKVKPEYYSRYNDLMSELRPIPCGIRWLDYSPVKIENAIVSMGVDRMQERMAALAVKLGENQGGMKEMFLQVICRGFGFGKNQNSMEMLGKSIKPIWLERHCSNLFQLESIFFGQAGFIPEKDKDTYIAALKTEYRYLSRKYNMVQPIGIPWKYMRMRPGNFPGVRLAQLSSFIYEKRDLIDQILAIACAENPGNISINTSSYWKTHYDIGKKSAGKIPEMGDSSRLLLMINVFLPLNGFFNNHNGDNDALESWLDQLEKLPPEDNRIMHRWEETGFRIPNAFYSQAFLFIYRNFCVQKRCLHCKIGQLILGKNI